MVNVQDVIMNEGASISTERWFENYLDEKDHSKVPTVRIRTATFFFLILRTNKKARKRDNEYEIGLFKPSQKSSNGR